MASDNKDTELGSSNQGASPSAGKSTGVALVPCCTWKCIPTANSGGVYFQGSLVSFVTTDEFSVRSQQLCQGLVSHELTVYLSISDIFLTQSIMAISKGCKPENFESLNSLKLSFTNICGFLLNFVEYESFLESNSFHILVLCEINLDDSIDSGNFSVTGYLSLI